jgi:hypothetical protein
MRPTWTAILVLCAATSLSAATPNLSAIRPTGGQRGTELEITLSGARLGDAQEILYYQPGISTVSLAKVDDNNVKAKIKIAPDCRLGLHDLRLRTATGISELRTFSIGATPETAEKEPNNDFANPQPIAMNSTVNGVADNEDVDYFVVEAKKGDRISAEVEGIRLGITLFDPYVAIMDAKRFELASSDDAALVWQDGEASVVAPSDGKYIIQVRESAYAGNGGCLYRLHVGNFPRPTATVPSGGKFGEKLAVSWIGDVTGPKTTEITLPAAPDSGFGLFAQDEKGIAPYPNVFRLSPYGNVIEKEPNEDQATATPFTPPMALNGVIDKPGDTDFFVFHALKGQAFEFRVYARGLRSPLDSVLHLAKKGGNYIAGADDNFGPDSFIRFGVPEEADYVIWIHDHLKKGGPDYTYRIEVSPIVPKLVMSVSNEGMTRGTGQIVAAIPKGNRQAILVNASRADFGGELKLSAEGLPPGVELQADTMAANLGAYPVLLTAKPDAVLGGGLARINGQPVDPKVKIASSDFAQTVELVLGQNNIPFWTRSVEKLAVAVTEEAPYTIEIVEPKVPMVRAGSMGLKVVAKRKEGFKAAIAVSLPWNPPGVGSAGGVAIAEGQNEAVIPMNADGGAELKTWKIVVNGYSGVPGGPIMVSSQLANLTIAERFVTLAYTNTAVDQGKETDLPIKVTKVADFPGDATVTLIGLPNKATTEVKKITKDATDLVFHIKTDPTTPPGNHANLFCQLVVTMNGEPIVHNLGTGALRVDVPLPPKPNAPAPPPMPVAAAAAPKPAEAPAKPLTRLEKLRLEQQEKAKAAAVTKEGPKK